MKLVIVESPAKAKTIQKFLGPEFKVESSYGHIRDLPSSATEIPEEFRSRSWARLGVDVDNNFTPVYVVQKDSKKRMTELKKLLKQADELLLATDEDREGEAISWHLLEVLAPKVPVRRITFHEITKSAIQEALRSPRDIDTQLVRAQESRRILDRLYGYTLSPVLWKKVRTKLSAGRVQSVAVRLVVEREEERQAFRTAEYWDVDARLRGGPQEFTATLINVGSQKVATGKDFDSSTGKLKADSKAKILLQEEAERIAEESLRSVPWVVEQVDRKESRKRPSPPFITSTLQQAASSTLGMSPKQTMMLAQELYEGIDLGGGEREGLITYMRTDSLTLSEKALRDAGGFIKRTFGDNYYIGPRVYKTTSKSAQEAHEAIRPTEIGRSPESVARFLKKDELALYRLIWSRTVASQMADAIVDKTSADLKATLNGTPHIYRATGSVVKFPGFLRVYGEETKDSILPPLKEGQPIGGADSREEVVLLQTTPQSHRTTPPPRFNEATLVKKLEEEGIGRPSTYAPIISTIQQREYVVKKSGALIPTYVGMAVVHTLRKHFPHYVDLKFTAHMEDELDEIASGNMNWQVFLSEFYHGQDRAKDGLLKKIEEEMPKIEFPTIPIGFDPDSGEAIFVRIGQRMVFVQRGEGGENNSSALPMNVLIDELTPEKALEILETNSKGNEPIGVDPQTGQNIYALLGPYGPYVQLGEGDEKKKPRRVSLPKGKNLQDLTLEYALKLLSLPREIGIDPESGKRVTAGLGRFGPYVECGGKYKSIKSEEELFHIGLEDALERIKAARPSKVVLKELGPHPESGNTVQVMEGRYGPYVTDGKVNASLNNGLTPDTIAMDQALALLAEAATRKKPSRGRASTRSKTTTAKPKTTTKAKAKAKAPAKAKKAQPVVEDAEEEEKPKKIVRRVKGRAQPKSTAE